MHLYREFPPHPALAAHVACLWTSRAVPEGAPVRTRVLPDNCIDILWQDAAPLGMVAGMMARPHHVEMAAPVLTVAVRFLPGAARPVRCRRLGAAPGQRFWVHLDVDVLDAAVMPAVDSPGSPGIAPDDIAVILSGLVSDPRCAGTTVTVFDPDLDPDGRHARTLVELLGGLPFRLAADDISRNTCEDGS